MNRGLVYRNSIRDDGKIITKLRFIHLGQLKVINFKDLSVVNGAVGSDSSVAI